MDLTLREWSAVMSALAMFVGTIWYIYLIVRNIKIKPVLASWVVSGGTLFLSFATYWTSPVHNIVSNIANFVAALGAGSILVVLLVKNLKEKTKITFSTFQKGCLWASALIGVFWVCMLVTGRSGVIPNILTQILMVISYVITVQKLWSATKNTESFLLWGGICLSGLFGFYTAWTRSDHAAMFYALRSAACSGGLVLLMCRIEYRAKAGVL